MRISNRTLGDMHDVSLLHVRNGAVVVEGDVKVVQELPKYKRYSINKTFYCFFKIVLLVNVRADLLDFKLPVLAAQERFCVCDVEHVHVNINHDWWFTPDAEQKLPWFNGELLIKMRMMLSNIYLT